MIKRELFEGDIRPKVYMMALRQGSGREFGTNEGVPIDYYDVQYRRYFELDLDSIELPSEPRELEFEAWYQVESLCRQSNRFLRQYRGPKAPTKDQDGDPRCMASHYRWGPKVTFEDMEGW